MQGRRVYADVNGSITFSDGDYGLDPKDGCWYARPPGSHLGSLSNHDVVEHEDGTITVSPSILVTWVDWQSDDKGMPIEATRVEKQWHGYLERGIWREV